MTGKIPFSDDDAFTNPESEYDAYLGGEGNSSPLDDLAESATDEVDLEKTENDLTDDAENLRSNFLNLLAKARNRGEDGDFVAQSNLDFVLENSDSSQRESLERLYWSLRPSLERQVKRANLRAERPLGLIVDDDIYTAREYGLLLDTLDIQMLYAYTVDDALRLAEWYGNGLKFILVDIRMPPGDYFDSSETAGGLRSGLALASQLSDLAPAAELIALTNSNDPMDIAWFDAHEHGHFCRKHDYPPDDLLGLIRRKIIKNRKSLKSFIIHGHDLSAALELKSYLQNSLGFAEPVILSEKRSRGMTVIEKLEHYLGDADIVFALFTPDDFVSHPTSTKRARQNVILEFGIVLGMLGRKSGRVFYLYKQGVEIPSDLNGVIYIDITAGVSSVDKQIRTELEDYIDS